MTLEFDAVLFDAGGTLFEMRPTREEILGKVLAALGATPDKHILSRATAKAKRSLDREFAKVEGTDERAYWAEFNRIVLAEIGFEGDFEKVSGTISAEFRQVGTKAENWADFPETKPVLEKLSATDLKLGVVSNATDLLRKVLDRLDLTRFFDIIIVSSEVGIRKPDPEIFRMAASQAGTFPNRAIFIGDRLTTDVIGAKRAGMNAVLVDRADAYPDCNCIRKRNLNFLCSFT